MYKVKFNLDEVYTSGVIEDALAFALSLHRSSNVPHFVTVSGGSIDSVITLELKEHELS